jgi:hypothetical protein
MSKKYLPQSHSQSIASHDHLIKSKKTFLKLSVIYRYR